MKTKMIALACAATLMAPVALAEDGFPITFQYDRSELTTEAGAKAVQERLEGEIKNACESLSHGQPGLEGFQMKKACIKSATQEANEQINLQQQMAANEGQSQNNQS